MRQVDVDVLVVGAGPTGLTCAALLARMGVRVTAITRYPGLANSPRAHIINQRTMEVFRDLGIEETVTAAAMPASLMGQVVWAESFAGPEIARRSGWGAGADRLSEYAAASPCVPTNIPQHVLEPILCEVARAHGADIVFDLELVAMRQEPDRVISTCRDRASGEEVEVVSRYAVGADGDSSTVCREIGFEVEGMSGLGHMINYWIRADLTAYTAHRPGALYQIFRPGGRAHVDNAVWVNVQPWDEWVMSLPYDPAEGDPDRSEEHATRLARHYVGDDTLKVDLIGASTWTINQVHAEVMDKGRVVIAGNAAHRHPPAGGLGANTCVQDAFNLAWKLRLVLDGTADEALLATYSQERAPVARQIVEQANVTMRALMAIPGALGLRPGQSEEEAQACLDLRSADSEEGRRVRAALAEALRLQDYNFNALGVELGQRYVSDAIVEDGSEAPSSADPLLHYAASTAPGCSLPHAWLTRDGEKVSSLDVVGRDRFTLVVGVAGAPWRRAADEMAGLGLPLDVVGIGAGLEVDDPYGEWMAVCGMEEDGCLLVRPDRYVVFRAARLVADPRAVLEDAINCGTGRAVTAGHGQSRVPDARP